MTDRRTRRARRATTLLVALLLAAVASVVSPGTASAGVVTVGTITGTVTDGATHLPIAGVQVLASSYGNYGVAVTDASGNYELTLAEDTYTLYFEATPNNSYGNKYAAESYDNTQNYLAATPVHVIAGDTLDIDAELARNPLPVIEGWIFNGNPLGEAIQGLAITVFNLDGSVETSAVSGADGHYSINDLPHGHYKIRIAKAGFPTYWYAGGDMFHASSFATGYVFTPQPGYQRMDYWTGVDTPTAPAPITGTTTDADSTTPLAGVRVNVFDPATGVRVATKLTDANGNYTITSPPAGDYKVQFVGPASYATQWAGGGGQTKATAMLVPFVAGTTTTYDAALTSSAVITGTVTDATTTAPIAGVRINVFNPATGVRVATKLTDSSGNYTITSPPAGSYKIQFVGSPTHATWWAGGGGQTKATATPVTTTAGTNTYNAALPSL